MPKTKEVANALALASLNPELESRTLPYLPIHLTSVVAGNKRPQNETARIIVERSRNAGISRATSSAVSEREAQLYEVKNFPNDRKNYCGRVS